jgi:hypothetical protein
VRRAIVWGAAATALALVWLGFSRLSPPVEEPKGETRTETRHDVNEPEYPEGLDEEAFPRLVAWLKDDGSSSEPLPSRDIFHKGARSTTAPLSAVPVTPAPAPDKPIEAGRPRLTGFVFSGGNLGHPVASIRFEGRMWLVGVGEHVGPFRVDEMVAGDEVTLVHQETGETIRLSIQ